MKQHKSTSKDNLLLSEMYGQIGGMTIQSTGNAEEAAEQLSQDDGFNSPEEAEEAGFNRKQLDELEDIVHAILDKRDHEDRAAKHEDGENHGQPHPEDEASKYM